MFATDMEYLLNITPSIKIHGMELVKVQQMPPSSTLSSWILYNLGHSKNNPGTVFYMKNLYKIPCHSPTMMAPLAASAPLPCSHIEAYLASIPKDDKVWVFQAPLPSFNTKSSPPTWHATDHALATSVETFPF